MKVNQNDISVYFVGEVKNLVKNGIVNSYKDVADQIGITTATLSGVINGHRNIGADIYRAFISKYNLPPINEKKDEAEVRSADGDVLAYQKVIVNLLAEVLANQRGVPVAKVVQDVEEMVSFEKKKLAE